MISLKSVAIFFGVTLAASAAHANLIVNGSFEDTTKFTDNTGQNNDSLGGGSIDMTGWTVIPGHSVSWIGPTNPYQVFASDGSYYLDITDFVRGGPFGGVSQTFATTAGDTYQVTFDLGSSILYGFPSAILASAAGQSQTFISTNTTQKSAWESQTFTFKAIGASTTLSLAGTQGFDYIGLDNVAVTDIAHGVPEVSTWAMLLIGFAGFGVVARRSALKAA